MYNTSGIWTNMVSGVSGQKCAWGAMGPANDDLNVFAKHEPLLVSLTSRKDEPLLSRFTQTADRFLETN